MIRVQKSFCVRGLFPAIVTMAAAMLLSGCAALERVEPEFEDSNQMFLEQAVRELNLGEQVADGSARIVRLSQVADLVPRGSKVSLVSLERGITGDSPLLSVIEDQLIGSLLEHDLTVLERDYDALSRLVSEKTNDDFSLLYLPTGVVISSVGGRAGATAASGWFGSGYVAGSAQKTEISGAGRDTIMVYETQLEPADYLVSYRVLECGIVYRKGAAKMKKREAMVGLHVRVQDTASGEILFADNLRGTLEDEVEKRLIGDLEYFRYSFYSHALPREQGTPVGRREMKSSKQEAATMEADPGAWAAILGVVGAAAFLMFGS